MPHQILLINISKESVPFFSIALHFLEQSSQLQSFRMPNLGFPSLKCHLKLNCFPKNLMHIIEPWIPNMFCGIKNILNVFLQALLPFVSKTKIQ